MGDGRGTWQRQREEVQAPRQQQMGSQDSWKQGKWEEHGKTDRSEACCSCKLEPIQHSLTRDTIQSGCCPGRRHLLVDDGLYRSIYIACLML